MPRVLIAICILLATAFANYGFSTPEAKIDRRSFAEFPKSIGDWDMINKQDIDEKSMAVLQVDDYLMRSYENSQNEVIGLYIGYFITQKEGKQVHSPRQCLPGSGWNIVQKRELRLPLRGTPPSFAPINIFVMGKGNERQLYLWWYQGRGRFYANEYINKLYLVWDRMTKGRTDGALVQLNSRIESSVDKALDIQLRFINLFAPYLSAYIPK